MSWRQQNSFFIQGLVPCDKPLLFRQNESSPFLPLRGPLGPFASVPNRMAAELAKPVLSLVEGLKQSSPNRRIRHRGSAAP